MRSFPPFPLYSSAGAVDGGGGAGWNGSGADYSTGNIRVGVSLLEVFSIRIFILFRLIGVEGRLRELDIYFISFFSIVAFILFLLVIFLVSI